MRAARYGLPLMLAIIGGDPQRFAPYVDLYHRALEQLGKPVLPIGVHSPGHVADTDEQAREELWPDYKRMRDRIGAERGWPPMSRAEFEREADHGLALRRLAGDGGAQDRRDREGARRRALRHEVQRRHAAAREADAQHRALRRQGHPPGAGHAGVTSVAPCRTAVSNRTGDAMITLYSYPELFGVADNNGYGLKVFAFLRLTGVPFTHQHIFDASAAPRGQLPYIDDDGEAIGDSDAIISHLTRKYRLTIDDGLTAAQRDTDL